MLLVKAHLGLICCAVLQRELQYWKASHCVTSMPWYVSFDGFLLLKTHVCTRS